MNWRKWINWDNACASLLTFYVTCWLASFLAGPDGLSHLNPGPDRWFSLATHLAMFAGVTYSIWKAR